MVGIPLRQNAFSPIVETNASHEHKRHVSFVLVAMRFAALVGPIVFVGLSLSGGKHSPKMPSRWLPCSFLSHLPPLFQGERRLPAYLPRWPDPGEIPESLFLLRDLGVSVVRLIPERPVQRILNRHHLPRIKELAQPQNHRSERNMGAVRSLGQLSR